MFLKLLFISLLITAVALAALAVRVLLRPRGKFPETHISRNKEMRKRGITCAQHTDTGCIPADNQSICVTCSSRML